MMPPTLPARPVNRTVRRLTLIFVMGVLVVKRNRLLAMLVYIIFLCVVSEAQTRRRQNASTCPDNPRLIKVSAKVLKDRATHQVEAQAPQNCRCQGKVVVHILIDAEGNVVCARYKLGHPALRKVALGAVKQWKFKPIELSGVRIKYQGDLELDIQAKRDDKPGV